MNITSHEEYGLRCALQLARLYGQGPVAASKVAEKEGISVEYVAKFMHLFRRAGLVQSVRGTQGGFSLAKSPDQFSIANVLEALNPRRKETAGFCNQFTGKKEACVHVAECSVRPVWGAITEYFEYVIAQVTLAHLMSRETEVNKKVEEVLAEALQKLHRPSADSTAQTQNIQQANA